MKTVHKVFLIGVYLLGVFLRLYPHLSIDPHLLTFQGDIWYRLAMAQYIFDHNVLPNPDLRYIAFGKIPMWYPPLSPLFLSTLSRLSGMDLPTVSSLLIPFIEAFSPLPIFYLARHLYDDIAGYISTIVLALTPTFVFWSGISDPQSLTFFLIPLYILLWLKHAKEPSARNVALLGVVLALNFLVHLSYFVAALVLLSVTSAIVIKEKRGVWLFRDLFIALLISQILTIPWWLPNNLYWWWIKVLVTSSGLYSVNWQIGDYGIVAFVFGSISLTYLIGSAIYRRLKKAEPRITKDWTLLILLWTLPLFIESQNETILFALNRVDLTWSTLAKPLEGFRFFPYLAQPAAIAVGAFFSDIFRTTNERVPSLIRLHSLIVLIVAGLFFWGITGPYGLETKFQTSGLVVEEYDAALWFRENSNNDSRIAADYYRAQMFSGVTGGKALDGGMFPLRNVDLPYISVPARVQDDLYKLYTTKDSETANDIAKRYGVTHVFYSKNMELYGNLLSNHRPASQYGIPILLEKFNDPRFFNPVYEDSPGSIIIFEVV